MTSQIHGWRTDSGSSNLTCPARQSGRVGCVARCQIPINGLGSCTRSGNVLMNTPTMFSMPATSGGIRSWAVAHALTGQPIGPGLVHRTCAELQQQFFDPPLETRSGVGKYR